MPDGQGYVVLDEYGLVHKFGSATSPRHRRARCRMGYYPGQDLARSIAVTPDGKGYVILLADGTILKFGSRRHRRRSPRSGQPGVAGGRHRPGDRGDARRRRATSCSTTSAGSSKYGSALAGRGRRRQHAVLGRRHRARPHDRVRVRHRVRVLRARRAGAACRHQRPRAQAPTRRRTLFRDRWRGMTIYGGKPLLAAQRRHARTLDQLADSASAVVRAPRRSAAPRRAPSCGTRPPPRRARWSRSRSGRGRAGPTGRGRSASGSRVTAGSRRTTTA